mmetsp:Transcript_27008/g.56280  ORF Transcript_27008/g.56280 Transcript_27008/m.56280 type:complete len:82 (-) Transcript_27008:212-457(-)
MEGGERQCECELLWGGGVGWGDVIDGGIFILDEDIIWKRNGIFMRKFLVFDTRILSSHLLSSASPTFLTGSAIDREIQDDL